MTGPANGRFDASVDALIDELLERQVEFGDHLLIGVERAIPDRLRPYLFDQHAEPQMRRYLPVGLECMRHGTVPDPDVVAPISEATAGLDREGIPLIVPLAMVRAAIARFGGFVLRQAGPRRVPAALVVLGRAAMVSHDLARAATRGYAPDPVSEPVTLAATPKRILELAALGRSTREIATELHYSDQAVTYHLGRLMKQFAVPNRTALIARALQQGAIELPEELVPEQ